MTTFNPRTLNANEVDVRVQSVLKNGAILLLYMDARACMDILDETVGPLNWKREHTRDNKNCVLSIWDEDKSQWISKEDVGMESNTDAEKGLASDAFKRAAVNFGIGRELYSAPFLWAPENKITIKSNDRGGFKCDDKFTVSAIEYDEHRSISYISIMNAKTGVTIIEWGKKKGSGSGQQKPNKSQTSAPAQDAASVEEIITEDEGKALVALGKELFKDNWSQTLKTVAKKYGYEGTKDMKRTDYNKIVAEIKGMAA